MSVDSEIEIQNQSDILLFKGLRTSFTRVRPEIKKIKFEESDFQKHIEEKKKNNIVGIQKRKTFLENDSLPKAE